MPGLVASAFYFWSVSVGRAPFGGPGLSPVEGTMPRPLPKRLRDLDAPPEGRIWLAMVATGWAKDADLGTAVRQACHHGTGSTPASGPLLLAHVTPDTYVDGMGSINWTMHPDASGDGIEDANRPAYVLRVERR